MKIRIVIALLLLMGALGFTSSTDVSAGGGQACGVNNIEVSLISPVSVRSEPWTMGSITGNFSGIVWQWVAVKEQSTDTCFVRLTDQIGQIGWALMPDLVTATSVSQAIPTATQSITGPQPTFTPIPGGIVPTSTAPANVVLPPAPLPPCSFAAGDANGFPVPANTTISGYLIVVDKDSSGTNIRATARVIEGQFTSGQFGAHVWYYMPNPCDIEAERVFVLP